MSSAKTTTHPVEQIAPQTEQAKSRFTITPRRAQIIWGYIFISPWVIGFLIFFIGPMLASLYLSFTSYDLRRPDSIALPGDDDFGLHNYERIFSLQIKTGDSPEYTFGFREFLQIGDIHIASRDHRFWQATKVTLSFAAISLPVNLGIALFFAVLTNMKIPASTFFRTLFYLPTVIPAVVAAFVFRQFLRESDGWLNYYLLDTIDIKGPAWLTDPTYAIPALAIVGTWGIGTAMLIFLAGLQGVPTELYEAAKVDGASFLRRFRSVTLPMISPVILYNLIIGLIGTFQYFVVAYNITTPVGQGGQELSMYFYNLHLYREAYVFFQMGYASALAWILFIIVMGITLIIFRTSRRWVYYAGEGR